MQIVTIATVKTFRKTTLTSGYDSTNTMFVRISDGYSVGADPFPIKKGEEYVPHHIRGCGYLYAEKPGYVMATLKGGDQGWTNIVETGTNMYRVWNPFEERSISMHVSPEASTLTILKNTTAPTVLLGKYSTIFGELEVWATPFKGLRGFMRQLAKTPDWVTNWWDNKGYNSDYTMEYHNGAIAPCEQLDPAQLWADKYPEMVLPANTARVTRVYVGGSRTEQITYVSVYFGIWNTTFTLRDGECKKYKGGNPRKVSFWNLDSEEYLQDAQSLGLLTEPEEALYEKAKRIAIAQFKLAPKPHIPYTMYEDAKPVYGLKMRLYLKKVCGNLLTDEMSVCEYRGIRYKGTKCAPILNVSYLDAVRYYDQHCVNTITPFQTGKIYESYGHGQGFQFITPEMEEWTKLTTKVWTDRYAGCGTGRPFTQAERENGVWAALGSSYYAENAKHTAVEASVAYHTSEIQFNYWNKYYKAGFVAKLAEWFKTTDPIQFQALGGKLRDFAEINQLKAKADEAIAKVDSAGIFWSARSNYPTWEIVNGNLQVSGLLDTTRGFYKTGTYFHYHYPTFKVTFNTSLEVVEAAITE